MKSPGSSTPASDGTASPTLQPLVAHQLNVERCSPATKVGAADSLEAGGFKLRRRYGAGPAVLAGGSGVPLPITRVVEFLEEVTEWPHGYRPTTRGDNFEVRLRGARPRVRDPTFCNARWGRHQQCS